MTTAPRRLAGIATVAVAATLAAGSAAAAPTLYTSQAAFNTATQGGSLASQGFEAPFNASNTLVFPGFTFSCTNCAAGRSSNYPSAGSFSLGINGGNPLSFAFDNDTTAFGFSIRDFGTLSTTSLSLVVNGTTVPLLSNFTGAAGNTLFFGITDTAAFRSVSLVGGVSGDNYYLDELRFGSTAITTAPPAVPELATWAMMIAGFGATGIALRRRTVRQQGSSFA